MTEDDEWGRKDRTLMEGHDQLVALKLPNLVGDGLHLEECITVISDRHYISCKQKQSGSKQQLKSMIIIISNRLQSAELIPSLSTRLFCMSSAAMYSENYDSQCS